MSTLQRLAVLGGTRAAGGEGMAIALRELRLPLDTDTTVSAAANGLQEVQRRMEDVDGSTVSDT